MLDRISSRTFPIAAAQIGNYLAYRYRNTSSQLPRCSPAGVTWKYFLLQQCFCL